MKHNQNTEDNIYVTRQGITSKDFTWLYKKVLSAWSLQYR